MSEREQVKRAFIDQSGLGDAKRIALPGDASTRRYERLVTPKGQSFMLMDQPPAMESKPCDPSMSLGERQAVGWNAMARLAAGRIEAFVACAEFLRAQGLSAPEIYHLDRQNGLLISEDLGDGLLARLIEAGEAETPMYLAAIEAQARLHEITPPKELTEDWPLLSYDAIALKAGADLFTEWFPPFAGRSALSEEALAAWDELWAPICQAAEAEATVFIHRDYHAENLLWLPERQGIARIGMIDFQDALLAHPSWDLHSLLQDARRDVSPELEAKCLDHYFALRPHLDRAAFMQSYCALAALNEVRILGIFARLVYRDKKPRYEQFMPRMWRHLAQNLKSEALRGLKTWFIDQGFGPQLA